MIDIWLVLNLSLQIFAIMDPPASLPALISVLENLDRDRARGLINKASIAILILLLTFSIAGGLILRLFGISLTSLRIAAGVILMAIAIDMLITGHKPEKIESGEYVIVPIATPLIVGPGTMTLLITSSHIYGVLVTTIASLFAFIPTYILLRSSQTLFKLLGKTFVNGLGRFMSIIIASFAAQMLLNGIYSAIHEFTNT